MTSAKGREHAPKGLPTTSVCPSWVFQETCNCFIFFIDHEYAHLQGVSTKYGHYDIIILIFLLADRLETPFSRKHFCVKRAEKPLFSCNQETSISGRKIPCYSLFHEDGEFAYNLLL
jgi:hypothetical protein